MFHALSKIYLLPNRIIHCWSLDENIDEDKIKLSDMILDNGLLSLTYIHSITSSRSQYPKSITIISNSLEKVAEDDIIVPEKSTVIGASIVLSQEYLIHTKIIDTNVLELSKRDSQEIIKKIAQEIYLERAEKIMVYRNDLIFTKEYKRYSNITQEFPLFKENGRYLITGGTGRIGLELANYLAKIL